MKRSNDIHPLLFLLEYLIPPGELSSFEQVLKTDAEELKLCLRLLPSSTSPSFFPSSINSNEATGDGSAASLFNGTNTITSLSSTAAEMTSGGTTNATVSPTNSNPNINTKQQQQQQEITEVLYAISWKVLQLIITVLTENNDNQMAFKER